MQSTDIPGKLPIPFANSAGGSYIRAIPTASQVGIVDGAASLTTGFPPLNFQPIDSGGIPPNGADVNGILFAISGWARWQAAGGPTSFDSVFSAAIGGYPKRAVLASTVTSGLFWVSTIENNTANPDSDPTNWLPLAPLPATLAELQAGSNTVKYVTPATLAGLRASSADVLAGTSVSKYITPAAFYGARASEIDARTGTDDHKYLTPASLGGNVVITPGSGAVIYHPNGLIEQMGNGAASGSGNYTTSFLTPFLTEVLSVQVTLVLNTSVSDGGNARSAHWRKTSTTLSTLAYKCLIESGTCDGVAWHAFGR